MAVRLKIDPDKQLNKLSRFIADLPSLFTFEDTETNITGVVTSALKDHFNSQGDRGNTPWDLLKSGQKPTLVDTGKLRDAVFNPKLVFDGRSKTIVAKFSGEHSELIKIFENRYPIVVLTKPDFAAINGIFVAANIKRIKIRFKSGD